MPLGPKGYDLSVLFPFRAARFENSISTNGRFFVGPFTQFAVNTATYVFTYRFFANHSAEHPDGYLDLDSLMAFEGVTQGENGFEWESGREHIPENVCSPDSEICMMVQLTYPVVPPRPRQ